MDMLSRHEMLSFPDSFSLSFVLDRSTFLDGTVYSTTEKFDLNLNRQSLS